MIELERIREGERERREGLKDLEVTPLPAILFRGRFFEIQARSKKQAWCFNCGLPCHCRFGIRPPRQIGNRNSSLDLRESEGDIQMKLIYATHYDLFSKRSGLFLGRYLLAVQPGKNEFIKYVKVL